MSGYWTTSCAMPSTLASGSASNLRQLLSASRNAQTLLPRNSEMWSQRWKERRHHVFDAVMVCRGNSMSNSPLHCFPGDLCTSQGAWVLSRVFDPGYPWDMFFNTHLMSLMRNSLPAPLSWGLINYKVNQQFKHENYGLQPEKSCLVHEPVIKDDLPSYILTGRITIKPSMKEFKDNTVVFYNCPEEEPIDIVIFCTGYNVSFPFLEEAVVKVENKHASLYKYVFPTHLQRPTLVILGLIKPFGAIVLVTEMQARWVTSVFKARRTNLSSSVWMREHF